MDIKRIGNEALSLGEGPLWDVDEQKLFWVDSWGPSLWGYSPEDGNIVSWDLPGDGVGSLALRAGGGAILAIDSGFYEFDFETSACKLIGEPDADQPNTRFNDGKVDRQGRFVAGSWDHRSSNPLGTLYRLNSDFSIDRLETGIVCSNGPCWSPDGHKFYFTDSGSRAISVYDYDAGSGIPKNKKVFVQLGDDEIPDGATVDAEGYVWSATFAAGDLRRYAPDGSVDRVIKVPVTYPTSVMFGGVNLDILFFTSMGGTFKVSGQDGKIIRERKDNAPGAGGLFSITGLGVRGLPEPRFMG